MARHPLGEKEVARICGDLTYRGRECICGCEHRYTSNGACVECTKMKARARYATPEGRKVQREGDKKRYLQRTGRSAT